MTLIKSISGIRGTIGGKTAENLTPIDAVKFAAAFGAFIKQRNKGKKKIYAGVPGNLVAFACKLSFQRGHEGNVSFISKTQLVQHYIESLGAIHFGGRLMIIDTNAALRLLNKYFPNGSTEVKIKRPFC